MTIFLAATIGNYGYHIHGLKPKLNRNIEVFSLYNHVATVTVTASITFVGNFSQYQDSWYNCNCNLKLRLHTHVTETTQSTLWMPVLQSFRQTPACLFAYLKKKQNSTLFMIHLYCPTKTRNCLSSLSISIQYIFAIEQY